jgi:hypothetical protein
MNDEENFESTGASPQLAQIPEPLKFFLAGKAFFTLRSTKTGNRFTYRVVRASEKDDPTKKLDLWFVSFLTGPDNWQNYTYIGVIRPKNQSYEFVITRNSKLPAEAPPCKAISYTVDCLDSQPYAPGVEIWHAGRCGRCGRLLTVPESIASGFGPECLGLV